MGAEGGEPPGDDVYREVVRASSSGGRQVEGEASGGGVLEKPSEETNGSGKTQQSGKFVGAARSLGRVAHAVSTNTLSGVTKKVTRFLTPDRADRDSDEDLEEIQPSATVNQNSQSTCEIAVGARIGTITTVPSWGTRLPPEGVRCIVGSKWFDMVTGLIIVANSLTIGLEQSFRKEGGNEAALEAIAWLEHFFLGVYIVELVLRLIGFGFECLRDNWVKFDVALVVLGVTTAWIIEPIFGQDRTELAPLMVIRTMRLLRLARMVRLLVKFRVLWMLVRGLLNSAGTMFYTLVLLVIILYVFSAVGIEIITNSPYANGPEADEEFQLVAKLYFNSLPSAMLTLMQFVCMDSIGAIYRPLIQKDVTLAIYFAMIILVIPIVVMNLVTAIIVNSALEQALQDKEAARVYEEQKRARLIKKLRLIFLRLDDDKSGQVSREELAKVNEKDMALLCESTNITDPMEIFAALDIDGSGQISIDEFCDGIWQVVASKSPLEVQRMEKQVAVIFRRLRDVETKQAAMQEVIDEIIQVQEAMQEMLGVGPKAAGSGEEGSDPDANGGCTSADLNAESLDALAAELSKLQSCSSQKSGRAKDDCMEHGSAAVKPQASSRSREARAARQVSPTTTQPSLAAAPEFRAASPQKRAATPSTQAVAHRAMSFNEGRGSEGASRSTALLDGRTASLQVHEGPRCQPLCLQSVESDSGGTGSTMAEGAAEARSRSNSKWLAMEQIEAMDLVESIPELMRAGTEALEGGPRWAQELLAELKYLSLELAPAQHTRRAETIGRLPSGDSLEEDNPLGTYAPMGPPDSRRPLLWAGCELEPEPPPEPPMPMQDWPEFCAERSPKGGGT